MTLDIYLNLVMCFQTADMAVAMATQATLSDEVPEGSHTAEFLFSFGATCLER